LDHRFAEEDLGRIEVVEDMTGCLVADHRWKEQRVSDVSSERQVRVGGERLTSNRVDLEDCSHRTDRIVHLPVRAGSRRAEVDRSYLLVPGRRSFDHTLAEGGTGQLVDRHMVVADRIGLGEVDSPVEEDNLPAEEGNLDRSQVADGLGCSPVGRTDRMDLT
jgi:hypothetical protein